MKADGIMEIPQGTEGYASGDEVEVRLLCPKEKLDHAWDAPIVQQMLSILKSEAFKEKVQSMGGYTIDRPGELIEIE